MTNTTISENCSAKDRSKCRYHGTLQHASIDLAEAQQSYNEAVTNHQTLVDDGGSEGSLLQAKNRITNRKKLLNRAQQNYDAEPAPYKELKTSLQQAKDALDLDAVKVLEGRLTRADNLRAGRKKTRDAENAAKRRANDKRTEFEKWSDTPDAQEDPNEPAWRKEYRKEFNAKLMDGANIGTYTINQESGVHLGQCGVRKLHDVYEDVTAESGMGYYGDETYVESSVSGQVTCNCGRIFQERFSRSGTLFDSVGSFLTD